MSLSTKLALAFGASLVMTVSIAIGTLWTMNRVETEQRLLHLAQTQLESYQSLLARFVEYRSLLVQYTYEPKEATLADVLLMGRRAEVLVHKLIQENVRERNSLDDEAERHDDDEAGEEAERENLIQLELSLHEMNDELLHRDSSIDEAALIAKLHNNIVRFEQGHFSDLIDDMAEEETEGVMRRKARLESLMTRVTRVAGIGTALAGFICVGAVWLLNASVRQVNRARERETAANVAKSTFLANMSHEIRTPLNGILGFTQLLLRNDDITRDKETKGQLKTIQSSGKHLLSLINDVLDLSKVEAGRMECRPEAVGIVGVYEEVVSNLRVIASEKGVVLEFTWEGPTPQSITCDRDRLRQVLTNLVGNAIKFTDHGGVFITAHIERRDRKWILVTDVRDTGVGIAEDQLAKIFDPFKQADESITRGFEGTGLGLSISKRLANAMGGDISVESTLGEGSTFTLTVDAGSIVMPSATEPAPAEQPETSPGVAKEAHSLCLEGRTILVVDDGKTNRDLIRVVMNCAGAEVLEADNGLKGVKLAIANEVDAVLMDVQMPIMDGLTATARLRRQGFVGPVIALTAHAMEGDRQRCLDAGCSGYIAKPIDTDQILREVARQIAIADVSQSLPTDEAEASSAEPSPAPAPELRCNLPPGPEFEAIARDFIAEFQTRLRNVIQLRENNSWGELAVEAHWLKGAGGTAGFNALTEPAARLEEAARAADPARADRELDLLIDLSHSLPADFMAAAPNAQ